jgi:tetratricopeptide (TPR) repeat protein
MSCRSAFVLALVTSCTVFVGFAGAARAQIDCAQCRAVCAAGNGKLYPEELGPESPKATLKHKSADAEAAFTDARRKDPAFGGRDVAGAVEGYKRAVLLDADNSQYRNYLAGALMAAGNYDEAIYNLEQASRLVPAEPKYLVNLGYAHHRKGDETRALLYYLRALMLDPRDVRARLFSGYALEILGYTQEAATELKKVLNQDPQNEGARRALVRLGAPVDPVGAPPPPQLLR